MPAIAQHAGGFGDDAFGFVGKVQRLMDNHRIDAGVGDGQCEEIALHQIDRHCLIRQFGARDAQHFGAAVERGDPLRRWCEDFGHAPRAGADVKQMAQRAPVHHRDHRVLDLAFGDMARPDRIPFGRMVGEIAFGHRRALGANRGKPARILRDHHRLARRKGPSPRSSSHVGTRPLFGDAQEDPAPLAAALDDPGFGEDTDVARNARLALLEHRRQLADRQLHLAQQGDNAQARRVGQGPENVDQLAHRGII